MTGEQIAKNLLQFLKDRSISIQDCRAQGYDNRANICPASTKAFKAYIILKINALVIYSPCACHTLNLCGVNAAECCPDAVTFFGSVKKLFTFFSSSPPRWEILIENSGGSLHSTSQTRRSARIDAVKPIARKLPGVLKSSREVELKLNITTELRIDMNALIKYFSSFKALIMLASWFKILQTIDYKSKVMQSSDSTINVQVRNLESLIRFATFEEQLGWDL